MTWTYSGNPGASNQDAVRFRLGDTDSARPLLSDEEIAYLLASTSNVVLQAAATGARQLSAKFGRMPNVSIDGFTVDYGALARQFSELADTLDDEDKRSGEGVTGYAGGISIADMAAVSADTDRPRSVVRDLEADRQ